MHSGERLLDCLTSKPGVKLPSLDVPAGPNSKPTELPPNLHIVDGMAYQVAAAAEVSQVDLIVMQACKLEQTNDSPTPAPKKLENVLVLLEIVPGDVVVVRLADFQRGIDHRQQSVQHRPICSRTLQSLLLILRELLFRLRPAVSVFIAFGPSVFAVFVPGLLNPHPYDPNAKIRQREMFAAVVEILRKLVQLGFLLPPVAARHFTSLAKVSPGYDNVYLARSWPRPTRASAGAGFASTSLSVLYFLTHSVPYIV